MNFPLSTYSAWRRKIVSEGNENISKKQSSTNLPSSNRAVKVCRTSGIPVTVQAKIGAGAAGFISASRTELEGYRFGRSGRREPWSCQQRTQIAARSGMG